MTVKTNDLPTNNLNINEIEQNIPPILLNYGRVKKVNILNEGCWDIWYFINGLEDQTDLDGFKGILK